MLRRLAALSPVALAACFSGADPVTTAATAPTGATTPPGTTGGSDSDSGEPTGGLTTSAATGDLTASSPTGDPTSASSPTSDPTSASSPTGDPSSDPGSDSNVTATTTGPDMTTGDSKSTTDIGTSEPPGGCGDVDYKGYCDGDTLVWCEDEMLKMVDCSADGRVCVYQDDDIGYNCVHPPGDGGFGYPVGDRSTSPAGGWYVTQVLSHFYDVIPGGHLAHDIAVGEDDTANAPVYSVADGEVLYAGPNNSSYVHVVLIRHEYDGGQVICSFYGHLNAPSVASGQTVARGDQIATILDQSGNSHLHYVLLGPDLCAASDAADGALICGYDSTPGFNGVTDLSNEPAVYTSLPNNCGNQNYPNAFLSPTKFIDAHHF